jgi:hypothetical protein
MKKTVTSEVIAHFGLKRTSGLRSDEYQSRLIPV